jgi:GH24 family phage-related lysozyme (muramidase)
MFNKGGPGAGGMGNIQLPKSNITPGLIESLRGNESTVEFANQLEQTMLDQRRREIVKGASGGTVSTPRPPQAPRERARGETANGLATAADNGADLSPRATGADANRYASAADNGATMQPAHDKSVIEEERRRAIAEALTAGADLGAVLAGAKKADPSSIKTQAIASHIARNRMQEPESWSTSLNDVVERVKHLEGTRGANKPYWDYKQWSGAYGTKASGPNDRYGLEEAQRRLTNEMKYAYNSVNKFAPGLSPGWQAALTSLTYNAGPGWQRAGLGAAVKRQDWGQARQRFMQYNKAGGRTLRGLTNRRRKELSWIR